ncbi:MAG: hypothetical protein HPY50_06660 [Firmicutes bacterium]|nr:hypothetical protein [Bacillota bacterium]
MTDWKAFFKLMVRKIWILILITGIFGLATAYVSYYKLPKLYETSMRVYILAQHRPQDEGSVTYDQLMASQLLAKSYKEMIKSRNVLSQVINERGLNLTIEKLENRVIVETLPETSMIQINIRDEDPWEAVAIANDINRVSSYLAATSAIGIKSITVVDGAIASLNPVYPRPALYISLSLIAGVTISLMIILLMLKVSTDSMPKPSVTEEKISSAV